MKKLKHLLPALFAVVMSFALVFSVACSGSCSKAKLQSLELNTESATTEFFTGESFSTEGLVVTANFSNKKTEAVSLTAEGLTVDSSAYRSNKVGEYEIKVSYTLEETTVEASYNVSVIKVSLSVDTSALKQLYLISEDKNEFSDEGLVVNRSVETKDGVTNTKLTKGTDYTVDSSAFSQKVRGDKQIVVNSTYKQRKLSQGFIVRVIEPRQGIGVSLKDGVAQTVALSSEKTSFDMSDYANMIEAYYPDEYGVINASSQKVDLSGEKVTVEVFRGQTKVENLTALGEGAYTIWVTVDGTDNASEPFTYYGFQIIYVVDDLVDFQKTTADGAVSQPANRIDKISQTWKYVATYASGATKTFDFNAVEIGAMDPKGSGEHTVAVKFTHYNSDGTMTEKEIEVTYTIEGTYNPVRAILTATDVEESITEPTLLVDENGTKITVMAKDGGAVDVDENKKEIDEYVGDKQFTKRFKLGGAGKADYRSIKVEIDGTQITSAGQVIITVYGMSSGSGTERILGFYDSDFGLISDEFVNDGRAIGKYEFTVTEAGTYYLSSMSGGFNVYAVIVEYIPAV